MSHPTDVSDDEMIGALALAHGEGGGCSGGHISDKTLYIALNYQEQVKIVNKRNRDEIVTQLVDLENQQKRLQYYVSLLDERHADVLEFLYFKGHSQEDCAKMLGIAARTVRRIKDDAIDELTELYNFTGGFANKACPGAVQ